MNIDLLVKLWCQIFMAEGLPLLQELSISPNIVSVCSSHWSINAGLGSGPWCCCCVVSLSTNVVNLVNAFLK